MGWSGGTKVFDTVCGKIVNNYSMDKNFKTDFIITLIEELQSMDWDTESESDYFDNEIVKAAFCRLGFENWYDDEENV